MEKMWAGRFAKELNKEADDFNSSIHFDCKMYKQDITGSMKHATMLAMQKIITDDDCDKILAGLQSILDDLDSGALKFDMDAEDIHMFVESELTKRIGDVGKKLHTARSRNDQVAVDIRLYLRDETEEIIPLIKNLLAAILSVAKDNKNTILPGYTHLQRAQPITFAHHLLAYAMMFIRDIGRLEDAMKRMNYSPLGSCALSGTTYNTNREFVAEQLGFDGITLNSIDGVSDRDFCVELMSAFATIMMHLSRFSEEIILWSSWEFKFIELDDSFTTGSSIMPQKKNPDMAELIRGKTGRVYGDLMSLLTICKGLPLAYNKDLQEDKIPVFDAGDTLKASIGIFTEMILTMQVKEENMENAAKYGYMNATDAADYLVSKGIPFRDCHEIIGKIVLHCINKGIAIEEMTMDEFKSFSPEFEDDIYEKIAVRSCIKAKKSKGSTSFDSVKQQLADIAAHKENR